MVSIMLLRMRRKAHRIESGDNITQGFNSLYLQTCQHGSRVEQEFRKL